MKKYLGISGIILPTENKRDFNAAHQCWLELYEEERDKRIQAEQERDLLKRKLDISTANHKQEIEALKVSYERRIDGLIQFGAALANRK